MKKKLPHFKTAEEEAKFWDTHSLKDYFHAYEPADVDELFLSNGEWHKRIQERSEKKLISLRLAKWEIERSKEIAKKKKVSLAWVVRDAAERYVTTKAAGTAWSRASTR